MPITTTADLPITTRGIPPKRQTNAESSKSTLWRRARDRPSREDKAAKQQYLSPSEEKALLEYALRMAERGHPLQVKCLPFLAFVVARQRSSAFQIPSADHDIRPPGKNWPQGSYKRHPELKARRV